MREWYDSHAPTHRLPPLRPGNLKQDGWAELHGTAVKAANTRASAPLWRDFAAAHFTSPAGTDPDVVRVTALLAELYEVMYGAELFMTSEELQRLRTVCLELGVVVMRLREASRARQKLYFAVKPKMHKLQHIPDYAEVLNPRYVQNYAEESLIGTTTRIWQKAMRGAYRDHVQKSVLTRRVLGLLLRLEL